ncbi:hypothetical protein evm_014493 [Chilo suppressalis]|nr:hypothetical protein evm_014493 [Chilo suppressalis]
MSASRRGQSIDHQIDLPRQNYHCATTPNPPRKTDVGLGVGMANKPPASAPTTSAYNSSPARQSSMEEEDADRMDWWLEGEKANEEEARAGSLPSSRSRGSGVRGSVVYPTLEANYSLILPDLTAIRLLSDTPSLPEVILASAYCPGDAEIPLPEFERLVTHCEQEGLELIIAADSNAHHTLWGSHDTNTRASASLKCLQPPEEYKHPTEIDTHVNNITSTLTVCYEQSCPLLQQRTTSKGKHNWWGPELDKLRRRVRKMFNRAKNTRLEYDWSRYKEAQSRYKKRIRFRKAECWKRFCSDIQDNNHAARVRKILSSDPERNLGFLKKADNTFHKTDAETCELLMQTHFPAGLDGIFPGLLQWCEESILEHLLRIYTGCLAYRYIPTKWREVKVIFIPKPGKSDYTQPKAFRPISLTSFLLKVLERMCDRYLRDNALKRVPLHANQHAYSMGKSTESALHSVVRQIERGLSPKQSTLGVFIDIEGAFDKTNFTSISQALVRHGVDPTTAGWINNMLKYRAIQVTVNTTKRAVVARGCPQGGVLSPFCGTLWLTN